jgi:alcohol dehydrogenase class IV
MNVKEKADLAIDQIINSDLAAPSAIYFGSHCLEDALRKTLAPYAGKNALVVVGRRSARESGLMDQLDALLKKFGISFTPYSSVYREPTPQIIDDGVSFARLSEPALVIGAGGGSVIDAAKAIAALLPNEGTVEDYLEGVGTGKTLKNDPLPMIAIPTTAGTGAEMTKNAVICSPEKKYKKSMRDVRMIPDAAIIDPALTRTVPPQTTTAGGMDTITQLIESCISSKRTPLTTQLAESALSRTASALGQAWATPEKRFAREQLAYASFVSGVCLANSGLSMAHGIAAGLGALHDIPHGVACGILLPHTLEYNREACPMEMGMALARLMDLSFPEENTISDGIALTRRMNKKLGIPHDLKHLYLKDEDIRLLAEKSMGSSMSGNPVEMTPETTYAFLKRIC